MSTHTMIAPRVRVAVQNKHICHVNIHIELNDACHQCCKLNRPTVTHQHPSHHALAYSFDRLLMA